MTKWTQYTISALRSRLGWNKTRFAQALNVCPSTVGNWESGRSEPLTAHKSLLDGLEARNDDSGGEVD